MKSRLTPLAHFGFFPCGTRRRMLDTAYSVPQGENPNCTQVRKSWKTPHSDKFGFTIVEMMIATSVFGLMLVGMTAAIVQISRMFYKGVVTGQTQDVARTIIDNISRPIQFSSQAVTPINIVSTETVSQPTVGVLCVGTLRYTFALNAVVTDGSPVYGTEHRYRHALWQDARPADCTVAADLTQETPTAGGKELVNQNMRLTSFRVQEVAGVPRMYEIHVGVIHGEDELLTMSNTDSDPEPDVYFCKNGLIGHQWCALSELSSFVTKRI